MTLFSSFFLYLQLSVLISQFAHFGLQPLALLHQLSHLCVIHSHAARLRCRRAVCLGGVEDGGSFGRVYIILFRTDTNNFIQTRAETKEQV